MTADVIEFEARRRKQPMAHADDATERAVIACILLDNAAIDEVSDMLVSTDFAYRKNEILWLACLRLHKAGSPIEFTTLRAELVAAGMLDKAGGDDALFALSETIPTPIAIEFHARRVLHYAQIRAVVAAANRILVNAGQPVEDAAAFAIESEALVAAAAQARAISAGPISMKTCVIDTVERITKIASGESRDKPIPTRFATLNRKLGGGLHRAQQLIVAARTGVGKTAFALDLAIGLAEHGNVVFFSLEMNRDELTQRALSCEGRVDGGRIRTAMLTREDWQRLTGAGGELCNRSLHIDDTPGVTLAHIRAVARRHKAKHGLSAIVVDYLQLMRPMHRLESREAEISEISAGLKGLAKELDIPVVSLAQLNRDLEKRSIRDRRPQLSDLRGSGSIEQDADVVLFLYREELYQPNNADVRGLAEIIIGKQRSGPTGTITCRYFREYTRFEELGGEEPTPEPKRELSAQDFDDSNDFERRYP